MCEALLPYVGVHVLTSRVLYASNEVNPETTDHDRGVN